MTPTKKSFRAMPVLQSKVFLACSFVLKRILRGRYRTHPGSFLRQPSTNAAVAVPFTMTTVYPPFLCRLSNAQVQSQRNATMSASVNIIGELEWRHHEEKL